jgi:hypothetical protein
VLFTHSDYPEFRLALGKGSHGHLAATPHEGATLIPLQTRTPSHVPIQTDR